MLQEISPHKFDNQFKTIAPLASSYILSFKGKKLLLGTFSDSKLIFPSYEDLSQEQIKSANLRYLFSIDQQPYFLWLGETPLEIAGFDYLNLRAVQNHPELSFASMTAYHLSSWYQNNHFCGRCGQKLVLDSQATALNCPACHNRLHPQIQPAVIVAVTAGERLLMVKHAKNPKFPYALIAGFCEFGETAEATVQREVREEVGIEVKNIRYFGSQPWGIAGNLSLGYFAELDGQMEFKLDKSEIYQACWIPRHEISEELGLESLTGTMIQAFAKSKALA